MRDQKAEEKVCGIIMPISKSDGYSAEHWDEVYNILREVIKNEGFSANLVSDADEVGIIHNRIVQNIYTNPIIICDVSSKNPNVMFELGLRLAFDKATIIIKDDVTNYSFDTSLIEHINYPKDLRYNAINNFKVQLQKKLKSTYEASLKPDYSTFLKSFVQYKPKLETTEVDGQEFIMKQLEAMSIQMSRIIRNDNIASEKPDIYRKNKTRQSLKEWVNTFISENEHIIHTISLKEAMDELMKFILQNEPEIYTYFDFRTIERTFVELVAEYTGKSLNNLPAKSE